MKLRSLTILSWFFILPVLNFAQQDLKLVLPIGHSALVSSGEFSPDGKYIATSSWDHTAKVWESGSGKVIFTLIGHGDEVSSAHFCPDGRLIVTASYDGTAKIWEVINGNLLHSLEGHSSGVLSAKFSYDGKYVVTGSNDNTAKVWETSTGKLLQTLIGHTGPLVGAEFSPNGDYVLTASKDSTTKLWFTHTGKLLYNFNKHTSVITSAHFNRNGNLLVTTSRDNTAKIWDVSTGQLMHDLSGHLACVNNATFSNDGQYIITASDDSTARLWETGTGKLLKTIEAGIGWLHDAKFNANGELIMISGDTPFYINYSPSYKHNTVQVWQLKTEKRLFSLMGRIGGTHSAQFSSDGKFIITTHDDYPRLWDAGDGKSVSELKGNTNQINSARFSPSCANDPIGGKFIVAAGGAGTAKIWNTESGKLLYSCNGHAGTIASVRFSPNGYNFVSSSYDSTAKVWDARSGKNILTLKGHKAALTWADFSPDGRYIVTASFDLTAKIWEVSTGRLLHTLQGHSKVVLSAEFSSDGKYLVTASRDGTAKIWDTSGVELKTLTGHHGLIFTAQFSEDGKQIVTASLDKTVKLWDVVTGSEIYTFEGHTQAISSAEFSTDGKFIITCSFDGTAKVWDVASRRQILTLGGNASGVLSAQFSADAKHILTACQDETIKIWDLTGKQIFVFVAIDSNDYAFQCNQNNFYSCTKNSARLLYYLDGKQLIGFDQLDIKYNRPDKIIQSLGSVFGRSDTALEAAYYHAWQKRVKRMDIDTSNQEGAISVPVCDFRNRSAIESNISVSDNKLELRIFGKDSSCKLERYNIWVNGTPIFGIHGINIQGDSLNTFEKSLTIRLAAGKNRIETSVTSKKGIESYRAPMYVIYNPPKPRQAILYFVGIGINRFKDKTHSLNYCVKDIRDLADSLQKRYGKNIVIDTLFNEQVSCNNVKKIKNRLEQSSLDDKVIIAYSGHGLISKSYDYYLSTYDINFDKPEEGGLPYDDLEGLLDSIPARKKLMLIDACHSGEIDSAEARIADNISIAQGNRGVQIITYPGEKTIGLKNSFELMQELFANVERGTGATVLSAAGGTQAAIEDAKHGNGYFTQSILELMSINPTARVSELSVYVSKRVEELSHGLQKPTSRKENTDNDWEVW